jgi:hypothetical protein
MIWAFVRGLLADRARLAAENLALRQQVAILKHTTPRPKLRPRDRVFWVWLARLWADWRSFLLIVQPETVIRWHRQGFRLYWRWKAGTNAVGRPRVEREIRDLIRRMARENPLWGAPRIAAEQAAEKGPSAALARSGARCDVRGVRLARPFARRLASGPF